MKNNKNLVTKATLLSVEEACQVPEDIREFENWWWLRSPGYSAFSAVAVVNSLGEIYEDERRHVSDPYTCMRPALHLESEIFDLKDGDKIKVGGYEFDVVCDGAYALCTTSIGEYVFRKDWKAKNANIYEASDVKKLVDDWFEANIKGQKVTKVIISEIEIGIA